MAARKLGDDVVKILYDVKPTVAPQRPTARVYYCREL
jgi:hypothetical protein